MMNLLKKRIGACALIVTMAILGVASARAASKDAAKGEYENYISYLSADWGPGGDTIYFIKQIITTKAGDTAWLGCHFWLCKMKWDGSEKQEIAELWPGQNASIDLQGSPMWMEVNAATSNVAFGVEHGNGVGFGTWVVGLDGKNLHRPFDMIWNEKERWVPVHPSWSPDGTKLVFEEIGLTAPVRRLVLYDLKKKERRLLTNGPRDEHPVWSPKSDWIAYTHYLRYDNSYGIRRIWLMKPDGSEAKPITDDKGKDVNGWWPSWNPEGTEVSFDGNSMLRFAPWGGGTVRKIDPLYILGGRGPWQLNSHHFGKHGWLLSVGWIRLINLDRVSGRNLAIAGIYKFSDPHSEIAHWGSEPSETRGEPR